MPIKRDNILSLIGSGRYHSCILTTFSFDFYFFEIKVMKWLRSCGVRNVNVFIDGHFYSELMQHATGDEMKYSTGYSLYPIFINRIFHPKIWLLFGENEGLLIVGSGNLTNSGNGSNDEIWGAYHFDIKRPDNAEIFSAAWNYISQISSTVKGIISDKTRHWISEYSQWLMELPKIQPFQLFDLSKGEHGAFLYNTITSNIWHQILALIGDEKIVEITAVSPYYDREGKALQEIKRSFPNSQINIILDEDGLIPISLPPDRKYSFYDWKGMDLCRSMGANQESKLHAKILHFRTQKSLEFCLFGSSNITPSGLGLSNSPNVEVSLFLKSDKGNILNRIGLDLKKNAKKTLTEFSDKGHNPIYQTIIKNNTFLIKLLAAEINYNTLIVYSIGHVDSFISVGMFDTDNRLIKTHPIGRYQTQYEIKLDFDGQRLRYIQLFSDRNKNSISNKIIVGNYFSIANTHPNPKNDELEKLCSQLQNGQLRNVLDLIHYAIIDEIEKEEGASSIRSSRSQKEEQKTRETVGAELYELAGYRTIESNVQLHETAILLSPSLLVLDALKTAHYQGALLMSDIRMDEQEENIGNIVGNNENEVKIKKNISLKILELDKRKLRTFFKNLYGYFHHDILFKDTKVSDYKLSLTDVTKYLIALELIHEFGGKSEKIEDNQLQLFFTCLPVTGDYDTDNVKGCCLNIIGDFLRLAKNGFKQYTFDYTKNKFEQFCHDALISTIVCILNIAWKEDEFFYNKTLLLNSLHYLGWSSLDELNKNISTLVSEVSEKTKHLKQRSFHLDKNLNYFLDRVCASFRVSLEKREAQNFAKSAVKGQIIYSSIAGVGYCYVRSVSSKNEYYLARPGFNWNENECEFINHFGGAIYRPLPLPHLTIVDI